MGPTIEIHQYHDFFEAIYYNYEVEPGCLKFSWNAKKIREDILFRIAKLSIDIEQVECRNKKAWQQILDQKTE